MAWHPRPLVLVDPTQVLTTAVAVALDRIGGWHPVMPISQPAVVRQYLRDAARVGTTPLIVIVRLPRDDAATMTLLEWMRTQPDPIGGVQILAIDDQVMSEAQDDLGGWMENALRLLLDAENGEAPSMPRS